jgi:hypothetical protein
MERGWEPTCHIYGLAWPSATWPLCATCHPIGDFDGLTVGALVPMESWKHKTGKESKHKMKATLTTKETTKHYQSEVEQSMRDSIASMEEVRTI